MDRNTLIVAAAAWSRTTLSFEVFRMFEIRKRNLCIQVATVAASLEPVAIGTAGEVDTFEMDSGEFSKPHKKYKCRKSFIPSEFPSFKKQNLDLTI